MKLYTYYRSSPAYRIRISTALAERCSELAAFAASERQPDAPV